MDKIQKLHNERGYRSNASTPEALFSADMENEFRWFARHTSLDLRTASIFEIGSGPGNFYGFLKNSGVVRYEGCDPGTHPIAQFRLLFPEVAKNVHQENALARLRARKKDGPDCVIAFNVLEHLEMDYFTDLFAEVVAQLASGGEFWIRVPCAESILSLYVLYGDLTHRRLFTLANFRTLAEMYGLRIAAFEGKKVRVLKFKDVIRFVCNRCLYLLNRLLFAFEIGVRKESGVFSTDILVILKKP